MSCSKRVVGSDSYFERVCGSGAWSASAAGGREWGWGSGIGARERV